LQECSADEKAELEEDLAKYNRKIEHRKIEKEWIEKHLKELEKKEEKKASKPKKEAIADPMQAAMKGLGI